MRTPRRTERRLSPTGSSWTPSVSSSAYRSTSEAAGIGSSATSTPSLRRYRRSRLSGGTTTPDRCRPSVFVAVPRHRSWMMPGAGLSAGVASVRFLGTRLVAAALLGVLPALLSHGSAEAADREDEAAGGAGGWFALPYVFYSPETEFGGGVTGGFFLGSERRPSSVQAAVSYTQLAQFSFEFFPEFSLDDDRWRVSVEAAAREFPDAFYGIGPGASEDDEETYTSRDVTARVVVSRRTRGCLRTGLRTDVSGTDIADVESGGLLDDGAVEGFDGGTVFGAGPVLIWDSRDNAVFPTAGAFIEIDFLVYDRRTWSDYDFTRLEVDGRRFASAAGQHVFGLRGYVEIVDGDVPFFALPRLGGVRLMRGYREGRFRDNCCAAVQFEYRPPLPGRFRGAVFGSVGAVASSLDGLGRERLELAGGAGLRYRINDAGLHIRADYALGREGGGFYLTIGEAF
ncbi:MAG: BamA/TamA family outer membrane protein [Candidatus Eisenbacteria bacterium]|nr:BamA/TamA family outer membrane protein [Candidatus Eisenbacteria bacterium]